MPPTLSDPLGRTLLKAPRRPPPPPPPGPVGPVRRSLRGPVPIRSALRAGRGLGLGRGRVRAAVRVDEAAPQLQRALRALRRDVRAPLRRRAGAPDGRGRGRETRRRGRLRAGGVGPGRPGAEQGRAAGVELGERAAGARRHEREERGGGARPQPRRQAGVRGGHGDAGERAEMEAAAGGVGPGGRDVEDRGQGVGLRGEGARAQGLVQAARARHGLVHAHARHKPDAWHDPRAPQGRGVVQASRARHGLVGQRRRDGLRPGLEGGVAADRHRSVEWLRGLPERRLPAQRRQRVWGRGEGACFVLERVLQVEVGCGPRDTGGQPGKH